MSKDAAATFVRRVFENGALRARIGKALAEPDREASLKQVADQEGLAFDDADFRAVRDDLLARLGSGSELSEESLASVSGGNSASAVEGLTTVFQESIHETNENQKYFLEKIASYNRMGDLLSNYLKDLAEKSGSLSRKERP
jgi:hypothetical protein